MSGGKSSNIKVGGALAVIAVIVAALNLRPGVSSVGPVLDSVLSAMGASPSLGGVLTAIPGLAFFLVGLVAVAAAKRMGLTGALVAGAIMLLVGLAARPWVSNIWLFLLFTLIAVAGIALANVLLPAWIKVHGGSNVVTLMVIYSSVLALGGGLGPATALVFHDGAGATTQASASGGVAMWQYALVAWAVVALVQVVLWAPLWPKLGHDYPAAPPSGELDVPVWKSPTAIALVVFFGLQSMNAYILMGWLPKILVDSGVSASLATWASMVVQGLGIVGGLVMPPLIARTKRLSVIAAGLALIFAVGYLLMIALYYGGAEAMPGWFSLLVALLLGIGSFCFPMAIALIPARTANHVLTARLSGFVQPVGYLLSAVGPFLVGVAAGALHNWGPILWVLFATTLVLAVMGVIVGRDTMIDHELAERSGVSEKRRRYTLD
nr:MFS transporter [Corynebacterium lactis]